MTLSMVGIIEAPLQTIKKEIKLKKKILKIWKKGHTHTYPWIYQLNMYWRMAINFYIKEKKQKAKK